MEIRRADEKDIERIKQLLSQVHYVHYKERPDLFREHTTKYDDSELKTIIHDDTRPVFVAVDENNTVQGYTFCIFKQYIDNPLMTDIKTLYIDDLCVEEHLRGQHIGSKLYEYVLDFAKQNSCYNVTLNVWECNPGAKEFYKSLGLKPQRTTMEIIM